MKAGLNLRKSPKINEAKTDFVELEREQVSKDYKSENCRDLIIVI